MQIRATTCRDVVQGKTAFWLRNLGRSGERAVRRRSLVIKELPRSTLPGLSGYAPLGSFCEVFADHQPFTAGEDLWAPPLLAGSTIAEVGVRFDGDVLAADPKAAWTAASTGAVRAVEEPGAMDRIVHLSFGDFPGREYTLQLFADHLIHAWDLARAIGADERLDAGLVASCATWFGAVEDAYRSAGAIAARPPVPGDADAQTLLLARFGRPA